MGIFKRNGNYVANVLYNSAIEEEKEWRREKSNKQDIAVMDELLKETRKLGYKYKYYADITNRNNTDKNLIMVLLRYIGRFNDEGISAELVNVVGRKGNTFATEIILNNYINSSEKNKYMQSVFYDNALFRIKDKKYLEVYLNLLKKPEEAVRLPLTMIMLGMWKTEQAKPYFIEYLNSEFFYLNKNTRNLVFISLEALSYYQDLDCTILNLFLRKLNSNDKDVVIAAKKSIKRLKRNNIKLKNL